jgi:dolichol-phosphate mannosyltransferase
MIAVVIPCYRVRDQILQVVASIGPEVGRIFVIDDGCPENSGALVRQQCRDSRVTVITHDKNLGVGAAVRTGYKAALAENAEIIIKLDGDGQMDPAFIPNFVRAIRSGKADYVKGNRFYSWEHVSSMPRIRLIGNGLLSFLNKCVSGYWSVMDPTNGFTAASGGVLKALPLHKLESGYFFESDMLFRLSTVRAVVHDIPMKSIYQDERSSLSVFKVALSFPPKFLIRFLKRLVYNYFLRDFNSGSLYLIMGLTLMLSGTIFGIYKWSGAIDKASTSGTVMLAALPVILGFQCLLQFLSFDLINEPKVSLHQVIEKTGESSAQAATQLAN